MAEQMDLGETLARLEELLPSHDPALWATLNPPACDEDIEALRQELAPYQLPQELLTVLQWHDGQVEGACVEDAWPLLECGPLLSAAAAREHYVFMSEECEPSQWSPSWLPIMHERWSTAAIELALPLRGMVVDASFPDPPRPVAASLTAIMCSVCTLVEARFPLRAPASEGPDTVKWHTHRERLIRPFQTILSEPPAHAAARAGRD
jgi:hypothetical protein